MTQVGRTEPGRSVIFPVKWTRPKDHHFGPPCNPVVSNLPIETDTLRDDKQDQSWPRYVNAPLSPIKNHKTQAIPFWYWKTEQM